MVQEPISHTMNLLLQFIRDPTRVALYIDPSNNLKWSNGHVFINIYRIIGEALIQQSNDLMKLIKNSGPIVTIAMATVI